MDAKKGELGLQEKRIFFEKKKVAFSVSLIAIQ